jgi:hypothetical protein
MNTGKSGCITPVKVDRFKMDRSDQRLRSGKDAQCPWAGKGKASKTAKTSKCITLACLPA